MRALSDALYERMAADELLVALLGRWEGLPSIITFRPIPDGAAYPIILSAETVSDVDRDIIVARGREIQRDIAIYGRAESHFDAVEMAAERVRALFHRQRLSVPGYAVTLVTCTGPISAPSEAEITGRIVTLRLLVHEAG